MSTIISGSSPSVTFSDGTTQATAAASALSLISTKSATGTAVTFTGLTGYDKYYLICENILSQAGNVLQCVLGTGSGPTYLTANYNMQDLASYGNQTSAGTFTPWQNNYIDINLSSFRLGSTTGNNTTSSPLNGWVSFNGFTSGVGQGMNAQSNYVVSGNWEYALFGGYIPNTSNVTAIKITFGTTFTGGTFSLYGISS